MYIYQYRQCFVWIPCFHHIKLLKVLQIFITKNYIYIYIYIYTLGWMIIVVRNGQAISIHNLKDDFVFRMALKHLYLILENQSKKIYMRFSKKLALSPLFLQEPYAFYKNRIFFRLFFSVVMFTSVVTMLFVCNCSLETFWWFF